MRLSNTLKELTYVDKYDYLVVNGELEEAVNRVKSIIIAEHSKVIMTPEELVREYTEGEEE
jgi:guanylate kinase